MSLSRSFQSNTDLQYPAVKPVLDLNFTKRTIRGINPAYTFTRNSSGTYVDADGYIKTAGVNQPRFDHDPLTGECKGLLVEESRTNLWVYSSDITLGTVAWQLQNVTREVISSPNFLENNIVKIIPNISNTNQHAYNNQSPLTTNDATFSVFAKADGYRYMWIRSDGQGGGALFDLINGEVSAITSGVSAFIVPHPNNYYRCSINCRFVAGFGIRIGVSIDTEFTGYPITDFVGDRVSGILLSSIQLELGSFPTSYISTSGSAVTRQPDQLVLNNAPISNQGTFFIESNPTTDGTSFFADDGSKHLKINQPTNQYTKSVLYYNTNRTLRMSSDNSVPSEYIYTNLQDLNRISLGFDKLNNSSYINGHLKKFSYYLSSLTEDNSRALTGNKVSTFRSSRSTENIVTGGLVLYLDVSNPVSYPGTGTTWTDLSGNGIDATLNGVGYNSSNGGSLVFDGDNDYAFIGSIPLQLNSYTVSFWVNILSIPGGERQLFAAGSFLTFGMTILSNKFFIWNTNSNYGEQTVETNVWYNWVVTRSGNSTVSRINGIVDGSFQTGISINSGNQAYIGSIYGNSRFLNAKISNLKIYNRALTSQEIQQNFNALRGRFGI